LTFPLQKHDSGGKKEGGEHKGGEQKEQAGQSSPNLVECYICTELMELFGISAACAHYVCLECTVRTRVVGGSKACPVCRAQMEEVSCMQLLCAQP
jgi:Zinc finger, C3HC4 type (RING finger)